MRNLWFLFLVGLATGFISEKLFVSSQSPISAADDLYIEGQMSGDLPVDDEDREDDGSGSGSGDYSVGELPSKDELLRRFLNPIMTTVSKEATPVKPQATAASPSNPQTTIADSQDHHTTVEVSPTEGKLPDGADGERSDEKVEDVVPATISSTQNTSPSSTSQPPSDTTSTRFSTAVSVSLGADEDNSLDSWDVTTPKSSEDEVLIKEEDNEIVARDGRGSRIYDLDSPDEVTSENLWERTEVLAAVIACGVVGFLCAVFLLLLLGYRMKKKDEGSYELGDSKLASMNYQKAPTKEFYA
ncbi:syndecan-2-like [Cheilinus undulatus]|uniref:syndecan-2-like n=1 Tax=Cheilinus undulatus TaxID=241271 RepID=UPI001BD2E020|nr:syndecan-2-like [Cheilinus undulatus]